MNKVMLIILILCGTIIAEEKPKEEPLKVQKLAEEVIPDNHRDNRRLYIPYFHIVKNKEELEKLTKQKIDVDFSKYNLVSIKKVSFCSKYEIQYDIKDNTVEFSLKLISRCTHMTKIGHTRKVSGSFIVPKKYTIKNNLK